MDALLIMPEFFDYPKMIKATLNELGYNVDYYNDRPSANNWVKAVIRVRRNYLGPLIRRYFDSIMQDIKDKSYDVVLVISGQSLSFSEKMIKELRDCQKDARFILYQWDSIKNFPCIENYFQYFDKCYSFDRLDVEKYKVLNFLPLFYTSVYEEIGKTTMEKYKYDCSYVGTAHPKKYKVINEMADAFKDVLPNQFIYHYMPSRLKYIYHKMNDKEYRKARYQEFETEKLSSDRIMEIFKNSRCILDSPQAGQTGLTMRTMECLGAKRKLITTNTDIRNYDFFDESNILVYDENIDLNSPFFRCEYRDIPQDVYERYSLRSWLKTMLS